MSSTKHKLRLACTFALLAALALTISCTGFFQNPTVSTITIDPPNPSVSESASLQLTAAGTDSNGNPITLSGGTSCTGTTVCWSSSTPSIATISTGGLLTGVAAGTTTITAASGTASATTTATVTLGNVTKLTIDPGSVTLPVSSTATQGLTATATLSDGTTTDVSATVTWVSNNTAIVTVQNGQDPMFVVSSTTAGSTTVFATYLSGNTTLTSNSVNVTVTP
jgi:Bacterial Ig-like domain (group 2)